MDITDDLLAVCAAGLATDDQKEAVCNYLADHPEQMKNFAIMMDKNIECTSNNYSDIKSNSSTMCYSVNDCRSYKNTVREKSYGSSSSGKPKPVKKSPDDFWGSLIDGLDIK